jgi:hypothetical protein
MHSGRLAKSTKKNSIVEVNMPTYSGSRILRNDEWLLLQIKEGPCSAGCDYCYENENIRSVFADAQAQGRIDSFSVDGLSTIDLARLTEKYREKIGSEMGLDEVETIFRLLRASNISRAGLIGSEPSTHRHFSKILDTALENGLELMVYTAGLALHKMRHSAINVIVLHLDYGRLDAEETARRLKAGDLPSSVYMEEVASLLSEGKNVHLRLNFSSPAMTEAMLANNFFSQLPADLRRRTQLKYSFNTRVNGDSSVTYETPESMRRSSHLLRLFVDEFTSSFPEVSLLSERPLFPCSFEAGVWQDYRERGGFVSSCDMEYTFYPTKGLHSALRPVRW